MKTHSDCIRCFFRQALEAAKLAGASEEQKKQIVEALERGLPNYDFTMSPPEIARNVYSLVSEKLNYHGDIYAEAKERSNKLALSIYQDLKKKVINSNDPLLTAAELAIAGNIIDYGAKNNLNVDDEIKKIMSQESMSGDTEKKIFDYNQFKKFIDNSSTILYLGDNAGETLFDRILIEEIKSLYENKKIIYAVKEKPIINDAIAKDAYQCGIDNVAEIISSGSDAPGTVLSLCSDVFKQIFNNADMIISKGQGNFEALSASRRPIFFLFMVKCHVVAEEVKGDVGDIVLLFSDCGKAL